MPYTINFEMVINSWAKEKSRYFH